MEADIRARGYTLVELLVTLAVIGIMLGMGIPAMRSLIAPTALHAWVSTYDQALHTTRHLAVSANRGVSMCDLDDGGHCTGHWGRQVTLFFDDNRDGQLAQPDDVIARTLINGTDAMRVEWRGFGERRFLHARATGSYRQNGRFTFCPGYRSGARQGRQLVVNVTGRTRVEQLTCADPAG